MPSRPFIQPPSLSAEVEGWLDNFAPEDRADACLLLDSLRVASEDEMRAGLIQRLEGLYTLWDRPILLIPLRDISDIDRGWKTNLPAVFRDFAPHEDFGSAPGSEANVSNIIRDIQGIRRKRPDVILSGVTLEELRSSRCRTFVFVGDYSGSGDQALNYLRSWLRNPTVRSWRSFGWISVHVVLYSCSSHAASRLKHSRFVDEIHFVEMAADFSTTAWTEVEKTKIKNLCENYTQPARRKRGETFGYGGRGGLFVMPHTVPNNLPAVLLQEKGPGGRPWTPLFPGRIFPPVLQRQIAGYRPREEFSIDLNSISDPRLAQALEERLQGTQRPFLLMLAALAGRSHDEGAIAEALATSTIAVGEIGLLLRGLKLIDQGNHLTDAGWEVLRRARMKPRKIVFRLHEKTEPYYPIQLRGVGEI